MRTYRYVGVTDMGEVSLAMLQGPLAAVAAVAGMTTSLIGASTAAEGYKQQAANAQALGQYQSAQYQQEADTAVATSQRKMEEQQRTGKLVESKLIARGAGSGLDTSTGSVNLLGQQIAGRNEYSSLMDLSHGQDLASGYQNMGASALYQGNLTASMAPTQEAGAWATGASSIFGTLGKAAAPGGAFNFG